MASAVARAALRRMLVNWTVVPLTSRSSFDSSQPRRSLTPRMSRYWIDRGWRSTASSRIPSAREELRRYEEQTPIRRDDGLHIADLVPPAPGGGAHPHRRNRLTWLQQGWQFSPKWATNAHRDEVGRYDLAKVLLPSALERRHVRLHGRCAVERPYRASRCATRRRCSLRLTASVSPVGCRRLRWTSTGSSRGAEGGLADTLAFAWKERCDVDRCRAAAFRLPAALTAPG